LAPSVAREFRVCSATSCPTARPSVLPGPSGTSASTAWNVAWNRAVSFGKRADAVMSPAASAAATGDAAAGASTWT
jgi:hypothetical protein